ncbi:MAG: hypothetical protein FWF88_05220 [Peptococcaceae bacterium]|nr:hypothetical protein [Peptococcaceae bacterium]
MTYRINFAILRLLLEIQEKAHEKISNMSNLLATMKVLGESEGDFVVAIEGLETELINLLQQQADIYYISTESLRMFIDTTVPLLRPIDENDDVVCNANGASRYLSDVEYEISGMAVRTQKPFWKTTLLSADRAEKNRDVITYNQNVANQIQNKYVDLYWAQVNKFEEAKELVKPLKEFVQVDFDMGEAILKRRIEHGGLLMDIGAKMMMFGSWCDPEVGLVLAVRDTIIDCGKLGVYAMDYMVTLGIWFLNTIESEEDPYVIEMNQKFYDYNQNIADTITALFSGAGDLVTDPHRAKRNIEIALTEMTNDQAASYNVEPRGEVCAAIMVGSAVDPFKGLGKIGKISKLSKAGKAGKVSKYEKFVDNGMPVVRTTSFGKLKVIDRPGMIKEMKDVAAGSPRGIGKIDDIAKSGKTGKFIDNTTDPMTKGEKMVVDDLVAQGKSVERIPANPKVEGGTPDFKVDGINTELKTLENANTNTGMKRVQQGFSQGAENVIIDARNSGLTKAQAEEILARAKGKYPDGQLPGTVEIWIDGQVITYP